MANLYTYQDFENLSQELGLTGQISDADYRLAQNNPDAGISLLQAKHDYNIATDDAGRTAANAEAERVRSAYGGYTGGSSGADYKINTPNTPSSFADDDPYTDLINTTIKNFNDKEYSYDPYSDPLYKSYKKTYTREGRRASEDTMAQAAAMTGGIPSSYAVTAGQQASNYYAGQMADKIPELEAQAYNRHQNEKNELLQLIALQQQERDNAYNKHLDQINYEQKQFENNSSQHTALVDEAYKAANVGDWEPLKALGIEPDPLVVQAYGVEYAQQKLLNDLAIAGEKAKVGDFSGYKDLGVTVDYDYISSQVKDEETEAINELMTEVYSEYGETGIIPSNMVSVYRAKYPNFDEYMKTNGFSIGLTYKQINDLNKIYPEGYILPDVWDDMIEEGYTEETLEEAGFKRQDKVPDNNTDNNSDEEQDKTMTRSNQTWQYTTL